ncbi:hypothetical protein KL921_000875 [Ogataea angusta]|uniref:U3 small nucleolar RNA-associated protein 25 n=1 Tax=Pichia angusta TaxID=870730 RepID=A0ABQ7S3Z3_PICAN|nr:hypothetical protein KL921_000875 [Ogataea angusta]KAG7831913.1 hypothetical protein KL920_000248 [Ogataea angusta]KAG7843151.1 hypothetical protein KL942_000247 [Ogataea angusta]KAG7852696.1 hypothetical protein KL940_000397 [Ogataea angusta]KAG7863557.1 hypothetical protein KL919_000872 [Ogataea angusta]
MPSKLARPEKRQNQGHVSTPSNKKKFKSGRKELREVHKGRNSHIKPKENPQEVDQNDEADGEEIQEDNVAQKPDIGAYSALITLLKSDHPEVMKRKSKIKVAQDEEVKSEEILDYEAEEEDDDYGEEENEELADDDKEQDNEDVHNRFDAFNRHFNDEDKIEKEIDNYMKSQPKIKLVERQQLGKSIKLDYRYIETEGSAPKNIMNKLKYHNVKQKLQNEFMDRNPTNLESELLESLLNYQNVNFQLLGMPDVVTTRYQEYYLLHCLNHIYKTRDRVLNNNEKKAQVQRQIEEGKLNPAEEPEFRDQGYTRPKVLILLPTRNFAWEVVNKLIDLTSPNTVEYKTRFKEQYYDAFDVNDLNPKKPVEFKQFFKGNSNDFFCLGIKFTRKTLKLFARFDQSDVIVASPLGLRMTLEKTKKPFLSSIEITVLDKAEGLLMQNWDHVNEVMSKSLNAPPKDFDDLKVDFSRIRMWAINDHYKYVAQVIGFTKYSFPELNNVTMNNPKISVNLLGGTAVFKAICGENDSELANLKYQLTRVGIINSQTRLKQVYMRFEADSQLDEPDKRFAFFKNVLLPQIQHKVSYENGTLIYFPSYIDYIRVKNYLEKETSVAFVAIDEYSSQSLLTRNRALFMKGQSDAKIMLYTERLHFYKRYDIKGVRNVIFYGIPTDPSFYSEVLKFIVDNKIRLDMANSNSDNSGDVLDLNLCMVRAMFSKLDLMKLEKIVGTKNSRVLALGDNEMNEFH